MYFSRVFCQYVYSAVDCLAPGTALLELRQPMVRMNSSVCSWEVAMATSMLGGWWMALS